MWWQKVVASLLLSLVIVAFFNPHELLAARRGGGGNRGSGRSSNHRIRPAHVRHKGSNRGSGRSSNPIARPAVSGRGSSRPTNRIRSSRTSPSTVRAARANTNRASRNITHRSRNRRSWSRGRGTCGNRWWGRGWWGSYWAGPWGLSYYPAWGLWWDPYCYAYYARPFGCWWYYAPHPETKINVLVIDNSRNTNSSGDGGRCWFAAYTDNKGILEQQEAPRELNGKNRKHYFTNRSPNDIIVMAHSKGDLKQTLDREAQRSERLQVIRNDGLKQIGRSKPVKDDQLQKRKQEVQNKTLSEHEQKHENDYQQADNKLEHAGERIAISSLMDDITSNR